MKALDLFSCVGDTARALQRAGFDVTDIVHADDVIVFQCKPSLERERRRCWGSRGRDVRRDRRDVAGPGTDDVSSRV
jgi:hypothetical protein